MTKIVKKASFEELIKILLTGEPLNRENAAGALGALKDKQAVEPLIKALKEENEGVRREVARAIENIRRSND